MRLPLWKPPFETALYDGDPPKTFAFAWIQWLNRIGQLFSQSFRTAVSITADYQAQPGDVVFANTALGAVNVTFPLSAQSQNGEITAVKTSADANPLNVIAAGNDQIQGAQQQSTAVQWGVLRYGADGAGNWFPI